MVRTGYGFSSDVDQVLFNIRGTKRADKLSVFCSIVPFLSILQGKYEKRKMTDNTLRFGPERYLAKSPRRLIRVTEWMDKSVLRQVFVIKLNTTKQG